MLLLERALFLDEMHRLFGRAERRSGHLLIVDGEAGAGKTALVRRFADQARQRARVLSGACDALATPRALGPLLDIAHADEALTRLLRDGATRDRVFGALVNLLGAGPQPTVFIIEDIHWADEATLDLLLFLGRRAEATRALVIATHRNDEVGPSHPLNRVLGNLASIESTRRMTLPPLSRDAVAELATGTEFDPGELHAQTRGNPFYVTEVLAAGGGVPPSVRDAVLARALRLPPAARLVLDVAAVIGSPIDPLLLREASGGEPDDVEACITNGMLVSRERSLSFRHELAREAILTTISLVRRVEIHAAILRTMEAAPIGVHDPARLANHADGAMDGPAVLRHAPVAARRASRFGNYREAAAHLASALRFAALAPATERADLFETYAQACYLTAQVDRAIDARRAALDIRTTVGDGRRAGENHCHLALLSLAACDIEQANTHVDAAFRLLSAFPPGPELAMTYAACARTRSSMGDLQGAIDAGEHAIAIAEAGDACETLIRALITVGVSRLRAGDERGRADLQRAIPRAEAAGLPAEAMRAYSNLGVGYGERYKFVEAEPYFRDAIAYAADHDLDHGRLYATAWLARIRLMQGAWDEAAHLAESVLQAEFVSPISRIVGLGVLATVRVRRGEPGAEALLDEALVLADGTGSPTRLGDIHALRAEMAWMAGNHDDVRTEARAVYDAAVAAMQHCAVGELSYWRWKIGDLEEVSAVAPYPYRLLIAGDADGAARAWDDLGCPFEAARARAECHDEASQRRALAEFERLGAWPAYNDLRGRLRAAGARDVPRGPIRSTSANPARLTRRQAEILALVAAGLANAEIADRLFLSRRTVENHVATIFAKLGVGDRDEAAREAVRRGLVGDVA